MKRIVRQTLGLSAFAGVCMALGMGLSYRWVAQAQEEKPVMVQSAAANALPPIAEVAEKLNPTVVSIRNTSYVKSRGGNMPFNPFGGDDFFDFFFNPRRPNQRAPRNEDEGVQKLSAGGSGVIISSSGEILTNHHVIAGIRGGEAELEVKLSDGRIFKAKVLGKDKELDIALIKIDAKHLPFAALGDSENAKVGQWVVAIGNPLGLSHTVTQGIISAKGRSIDPNRLESFLQTDAAINRGNSGGPLLNLNGEVIGINTAIIADGQNIGFAVPIDMVKRILADMRAGAPISRGFLGIGIMPLDKAFQDALGAKNGVVVAQCDPGGAAEKAGINRLDVVTAVNGEKVNSPEELQIAVANRRAGEVVKLSIWRDGKEKVFSVTLGDRKNRSKGKGLEEEEDDAPNAEGEKAEGEDKLVLEKSYGFDVAALTPATRHMYGYSAEAKGVVITKVTPRSDAGAKDLKPGMLITAIGTKNVESIQEFEGEVKKNARKPLILLVQDQRGTKGTIAVQPR